MKRWLALLLIIMVMALAIPVSAQNVPIVRQWASKAVASSEYTTSDWSAAKATGAPDALECADDVAAWASATIEDGEFLELYYTTAVYPTQVNIYQNYNPGAIVRVELIPEATGERIAIPNSVDNATPCPGIFSVDVQKLDTRVRGVAIFLDQSRIGDWNEIDAVELVGVENAADLNAAIQARTTPAQPANATTPSSTSSGIDPSLPVGMSVTCENGATFDNGVEITVIQMRTGFNYRATAIGLNGFDPVLAVLDDFGEGLCSDDDFEEAINYSARLPTTGSVDASSTNSQVLFSNTSNSVFADISLVVGGFDNQVGEFLLILEGMTASDADGVGDPFSMEVTPGMVASGVAPTAYVISVTNAFDPFIAQVDENAEYMTDDAGFYVACDDAGNPDLCWGTSNELSNSYISRSGNRQLAGGPLDAMLTIPLDPNMLGGYLNYLVSSTQNTYGDYIMVFHIGIGQP